MNIRILNKLSLVDLHLHFVDRTKVVMHTIFFALAWLSCRVADGKSEFGGGECLLKEFDERSLACCFFGEMSFTIELRQELQL